MIVSQTCHVLVEAKAMKGSFQPEQLAREYLALLRNAGNKVPLLFLILGSAPPVPVKRHGRLDLADAVAMHLASVHARTAGMDLQPQELLDQLPSMLAWTTWHDIRDVVLRQSSSYAGSAGGADSTVRRLSDAVITAIDWHTG